MSADSTTFRVPFFNYDKIREAVIAGDVKAYTEALKAAEEKLSAEEFFALLNSQDSNGFYLIHHAKEYRILHSLLEKGAIGTRTLNNKTHKKQSILDLYMKNIVAYTEEAMIVYINHVIKTGSHVREKSNLRTFIQQLADAATRN